MLNPGRDSEDAKTELPGPDRVSCSPSYSQQQTAQRQSQSALNARDAARVSSASCSNLIFPCSATRTPA